MFKLIGRIAKGIFKGVKDILPIPQVGDAGREMIVAKLLDLMRASNKSSDEIVKEALDILDDGKINESYDQKKAEMIGRIFAGSVPVVAYIVYGITTGDWSFIF